MLYCIVLYCIVLYCVPGYVGCQLSLTQCRKKTVADRGVSGPWGPQFCGALCYGETQRLPSGGAGSPPVG